MRTLRAAGMAPVGEMARTAGMARAAGMALALLMAGGCAPTVTSTHVERGEPVTTGVTAYDTFFREIVEVKAEAEKAGTELRETKRTLAEAAGGPSKAGPPSEAVRSEAKQLQMSGTLLHLDLVPEAKLVTSGKPDAESEKVLEAAEATAKGAMAITRRTAEVLVRIADLEKRRRELLATAKVSFVDERQRGEITRELEAAVALLQQAREISEKHGGAASRLALDLAMALETGAGSSAVATATTKKPGKPFTGSRPTGPAAKPKDDFDK